MNDEISDLEATELSEKLKAKFSRVTFDQEIPLRPSHNVAKRGFAATASVAAAVLAFVTLTPNAPTPVWAAEPVTLTQTQTDSINSICQSALDKGSARTKLSIDLSTAIASDFRGGLGFSIYADQLSGLQIFCNFQELNGEFKVLGIAIASSDSTTLGDEKSNLVMVKKSEISQDGNVVQKSDEIITITQNSDPKTLWNGEQIGLVMGSLSDGATQIELRSEKYPTWKPTINGSSWAMLVPAAIKGTLVQLNEAGEVVSEKSFALNK